MFRSRALHHVNVQRAASRLMVEESDRVAARDVGLAFASLEPAAGLLALIGCELPAGARSVRPRSFSPGTMPSPQRVRIELPLELRQAAQDRDDQAPMGVRSVGPGVLEAAEAGTALVNGVEQVEQVPGRARQPVEPVTISTSPGSSLFTTFMSSARLVFAPETFSR